MPTVDIYLNAHTILHGSLFASTHTLTAIAEPMPQMIPGL
jgi:hypothetical protein